MLVGGAWDGALRGECRWPHLQGSVELRGLQDRANPSSPRPGPQAKPTASPGQLQGPGLTQQCELCQRPHASRAPPQGRGARSCFLFQRGGYQSEGWSPACRPGEQLPLAQWSGGKLATATYRSDPPSQGPPDTHLQNSAKGGRCLLCGPQTTRLEPVPPHQVSAGALRINTAALGSGAI